MKAVGRATGKEAKKHRLLITISRQFASGGALLGQALARRLGFAYFDREILRQAAEQLGQEEAMLAKREERLQGFFEKFVQPFMYGSPEAAYMPPPIRAGIDDRALFEAEAEAIRMFAARFDAVIVGRCGFHVLRDEPGLVNVFIHAKAKFRVEHASEAYGMGPEEAGALVEKTDREREKFVEAMTGIDWADARNYHIAMDSGKTGFKTAEEIIVLQVQQVRSRIS